MRLFFEGKPPAEVRQALKSEGWRWSPSARAWQRKNTGNAVASARGIAKHHYGEQQPDKSSKYVYHHFKPGPMRYSHVLDELRLSEGVAYPQKYAAADPVAPIAPVVNVNIEKDALNVVVENKPPDVKVDAPVTVNVPKQDAPDVKVNVEAPNVTVEAPKPAKKPKTAKIQHADGSSSEIKLE